MNIQEFRQETLRTFPNLGSGLLDSLHMTVGIMTEIGEIFEIGVKYDGVEDPPEEAFVSLRDETSDVMWYLANYANIHGLQFPEYSEEYINQGAENITIDHLTIAASKLLDYDKKLFAYGKPRNPELVQKSFEEVYLAILCVAHQNDIDLELGMELNIAKLRQRFPEKFVAEQAINKDEAAERIILENK